MTIEYEIGQEWQLVNGETVTIIKLEFNGETCRALGSDMVWRNDEGYCVDKTFDEGLNFSHLYTEVSEQEPLQSDFSFRIHDRVISRILAECKSNGLFDALEFGRRVSQETTKQLKELV